MGLSQVVAVLLVSSRKDPTTGELATTRLGVDADCTQGRVTVVSSTNAAVNLNLIVKRRCRGGLEACR